MEVVWENEEIMVVNKPAGLLTLRENGVRGESVQDWAEKNLKVGGDRGGIAHRLDRETSGALLIAKKLDSLKFLMKQFKKRKIDKEYVALVHGWIEPREGRVKLPLANKGKGDVRQGVRYDGKMADTAWATVERFLQGEEKLSLLNLKIYTGRTHQIRVHLAHLGYPVFADSKYLNSSQMKLDRQVLDRHFLHARKIAFDLPNGQRQEVVVELPKELAGLVGGLERC